MGLFFWVSNAAYADAPVSIGTDGAIERATLNAAGPGSKNVQFDPVGQKEESKFGLQLRIPFLPLGDVSGADFDKVVPLTVVPEGPDSFIPQFSIGAADRFYQVQLGVVSTSFGHGTLIHRLVNSPNGHRRRFGMMAGFDLVTIGGQVMVGDVLDPLSFTAARATLKPLIFLHSRAVYDQPIEFDHRMLAAPLGRWTLGVTAASDFTANTAEVMLPGEDVLDTAVLNAIGVDNQIIVTDTEMNTLIFYVDVNVLSRFGRVPGVGTHVGVESMTHLGSLRLRLDIEGNAGSEGYIPRYFDQSYYVERKGLVGNLATKFGAKAPASFGYLAKGSMVFGENFSLFSEVQDQFPVIATEGTSNARYSLGSSFDWLMLGGTLSVSQAGISDDSSDIFGEGLLFVAEGRISLFFSYLQLIGRYFLLNTGEKDTLHGGFLGLEINLSL
ncbi:MAG: hypothetical protein GY822_25325 [Deltaproteobacteria bacterium]|nr:hypothetical protein [Deltaproteobacteria bacterium]